MLFKGSVAYAVVNRDAFLVKFNGTNEYEVPIPALALAAVAVRRLRMYGTLLTLRTD